MKTLCIIAIGTLLAVSVPLDSYSQGWKDKIGLGNKKRVKGTDLSVEETMDLLGGFKEDDGILSDFHQAHLGQIVFTTEKKDPKDITDADVKTNFSINDPIYFTFYMPKSFRNQLLYPLDAEGVSKKYEYDYSFKKFYAGEGSSSSGGNNKGIPMINRYGSHLIYLEIDGVHIDDVVFTVKVDFDSKATAFTGYILPHPSDVQMGMEMIAQMQKLSEGDHKVIMEIAGYHNASSSNKHMTDGLVASGEFTLTRKPGEKFAPVIGKTFDDFQAGMTDAALEKKFLESVIAYGKSAGWKEEYSAVKIKDSKWYIKTHKVTGVTLEKNIVAYVKSTFENGLCYVQEYIFRAQYNGSGYEEPYCSGVYNNSYPRAIDCE